AIQGSRGCGSGRYFGNRSQPVSLNPAFAAGFALCLRSGPPHNLSEDGIIPDEIIKGSAGVRHARTEGKLRERDPAVTTKVGQPFLIDFAKCLDDLVVATGERTYRFPQHEHGRVGPMDTDRAGRCLGPWG